MFVFLILLQVPGADTDKITIAVLVSMTSAVISFSSFVATLWYNRRSTLRSMRPVVVVEYREEGWFVKNLGNGAALDVIVAQKVPLGNWIKPVRVPPLAKDGSIHLTWLDHVNDRGIGVTYRDVEGRWYTSTCQNDLTTMSQGNKLQRWTESEIGRYWDSELTSTHGV